MGSCWRIDHTPKQVNYYRSGITHNLFIGSYMALGIILRYMYYTSKYYSLHLQIMRDISDVQNALPAPSVNH